MFHADFTAAALERGWLRLWLMEVDGESVAAWYGWRLGERYSYYLAGFEPRWSDASVGLLLLAHTVHEAIGESASVYDLLLGDEAYKQRFATAARPVETVILTRSFHPVRLLVSAEGGSLASPQAAPAPDPRAVPVTRRGREEATSLLPTALALQWLPLGGLRCALSL